MNSIRNEPGEAYPTRVLIAAILGAALGFLGASIVNVALPTFQTELGADATDLQWIVSAYNLAIAALLLSAGAFSDRKGHLKTVYVEPSKSPSISSITSVSAP